MKGLTSKLDYKIHILRYNNHGKSKLVILESPAHRAPAENRISKYIKVFIIFKIDFLYIFKFMNFSYRLKISKLVN